MSTRKLQPDPSTQQLANVPENEHQIPSKDANSQQPPKSKSPKRTTQWTGFAGKTLWNWLNLLGGAILIPVVIGAATMWFSIKQHESDQSIALDQQQQVVFQTAEDDIKDLLLTKGLQTSKPGDGVRIVARAEMLSALRQLDRERKGLLLQFLDEANLIAQRPKNDVIIYLWGADLSQTELFDAFFDAADLSGANLTYAEGGEFRYANLKGATMPDKSKHP